MASTRTGLGSVCPHYLSLVLGTLRILRGYVLHKCKTWGLEMLPSHEDACHTSMCAFIQGLLPMNKLGTMVCAYKLSTGQSEVRGSLEGASQPSQRSSASERGCVSKIRVKRD